MADRMPEWMADLVRAVPDQVVKDLVKDFRSYNPHPAQDPSAKVVPQGAGKVVGGDDGVAHRPVDQSGWVDPPQISDWTPPGVKHCDALMDQQDALDRAQRVKEVIEANLVQRALQPAEPKEQEPKARGGKK